MGLVIALIALVLIAGGVIWFVINRATTGEHARDGGSTTEISGAHEGATRRPADDHGEARPVVGGEAEAERNA